MTWSLRSGLRQHHSSKERPCRKRLKDKAEEMIDRPVEEAESAFQLPPLFSMRNPPVHEFTKECVRSTQIPFDKISEVQGIADHALAEIVRQTQKEIDAGTRHEVISTIQRAMEQTMETAGETRVFRDEVMEQSLEAASQAGRAMVAEIVARMIPSYQYGDDFESEEDLERMKELVEKNCRKASKTEPTTEVIANGLERGVLGQMLGLERKMLGECDGLRKAVEAAGIQYVLETLAHVEDLKKRAEIAEMLSSRFGVPLSVLERSLPKKGQEISAQGNGEGRTVSIPITSKSTVRTGDVELRSSELHAG